MNFQQRPDDPVKHVVLLVFENHSFDQMLGCFKKVYAEMEGVDPAKPGVNRVDGEEFTQKETTERQMILDPHHEVNHVETQLTDHNGGFVKDLFDSNKDDKNTTKEQLKQQAGYVMGYYPLNFLPALHGLAREFVICDHWYSSLPGPTWPNRFFILSGTSNGKVNMPEDGEHKADLPGWFQQKQDTLFDRLSENGVSWKIYFHDIPQSVCLMHQRQPERIARYFPIAQFFADANGLEAEFPAFSFIEPNYNGASENDDHPPHDVMKAQKLLADVFNAIRANQSLWESTLLVVLYDEHGGFYDHVEPPSRAESPLAVPPSEPQADWEYTFDRLGVRVPAILVSPLVSAGFDTTSFDHTSLLKYLIEKWRLGPLGKRTEAANSIDKLIRPGPPRSGTIGRIELTTDQLRPPHPDLEEEAANYISSHQKALALIGRYLKLELLRESPLTFAWLYYLWEIILHWLFGLGTEWVFRKAHESAKANWGEFDKRKTQQAIPILAAKIRDANLSDVQKQHAVETLSLIVDQHFHRTNDPVATAVSWLKSSGR